MKQQKDQPITPFVNRPSSCTVHDTKSPTGDLSICARGQCRYTIDCKGSLAVVVVDTTKHHPVLGCKASQRKRDIVPRLERPT